jgi:hypothetical protein
VGSRGGCALRGVRTGSRYLALGLRGSKSQCKKSGPRAPRMWHWHRLTSVRLVRDTSVDHSGRLVPFRSGSVSSQQLAGRVGCLCSAHGIQALLSHRHRRACPRHSPCCHGISERIICTGCHRHPVDRHRYGRGLWEHLWGSQLTLDLLAQHRKAQRGFARLQLCSLLEAL